MGCSVRVLPDAVPDQWIEPVAQVYRQKRGGFNSEILHVSLANGGRRIVEKQIGAKRENFSLTRARELAQDVRIYQKKLEALGIPIPPLEGISVKYDTASLRAVILVTTQWTGPDIEIGAGHWLSRYYDAKGLALMHHVRGMCEILKPVLNDRMNAWETAIGIDPKASNFTVDETGKAWYVDPFPPRFRRGGVPLLEWKPLRTPLGRELAYFKYFDVRGITLGLVEQLARIRPELKAQFEEIAWETLRTVLPAGLFDEFLGEIRIAPWMVVRAYLKENRPQRVEDEAREMLAEYAERTVCDVHYGIYTLREIALELAAAGKMSREELGEFFAKSHFEEELPREHMAGLVSMLARAFST